MVTIAEVCRVSSKLTPGNDPVLYHLVQDRIVATQRVITIRAAEAHERRCRRLREESERFLDQAGKLLAAGLEADGERAYQQHITAGRRAHASRVEADLLRRQMR